MSVGNDEIGVDVIVAPITPPGRGAVSVLRLSGSGAHILAGKLCPGGPPWSPRRASVRQALDASGAHLDEVVAVWMPGPRSYTGEDVVELSCHGNPHIVRALEARCLELGARLARPGEFTRRAVENGRMDLIEAEAVLARIEADGMGALAVAREARSGRLSKLLEGLRERALDLGAELEAHLDHPDEELAHLDDEAVASALGELAHASQELADSWVVQKRRLHGARVALRGPVNAGKSSLLNALLGERRALVSQEEGTTRDVVSAPLHLEELTVWLLDTAGLRKTDSVVEAEGQALGGELAAEADLVVWVSSLAEPEQAPLEECQLWVGTHLDQVDPALVFSGQLKLSSTSGEGLDDLRRALVEALVGRPTRGELARVFSLRQAELCAKLAQHFRGAADALGLGLGAAVAVQEVVLGLEGIDALEGRDAGEDLLDRLFSRFCIGK